jgi:aminoglycoside phosphotransferase
MLTSPGDLPADPVLDAVLAHLAPDAVLAACRARLVTVAPAVRDSWTCCRMIEASYHPRRYVRVAYALLSDPVIPLNRSWPEGQVVYLHAPLRAPLSRRGTLLTLGGIPIEAYAFPDDRRLRGLRKFAGRAVAASTWQEWLIRSGDNFQLQPESLRRVLLRYVPEQKWIVRLRATGDDIDDASDGSWPIRSWNSQGTPLNKRSIAVRAAGRIACAELLVRHLRLAEAAPATFQVPGVVGVDLERGLLATQWRRGQTLLEALTRSEPAAVMARIVEALRGLHGTAVPVLDTLTPDHCRRRAAGALHDLGMACPMLTGRLRRVGRALNRRLKTLAPPAPVTLHNDFHWNQVRMEADRVTILDLERLCRGDPWIDVTNFATQLRMLAYRPEHAVDHRTAGAWRAEFLHQWSCAAGHSADSDALRAYTVLSLLELARGMLRHLRRGWSALAEDCVDQAELQIAAPNRKVLVP